MDSTFAEILKQRNPALYHQLEEIRRRAFEEWIHLLKPDHGSHSGYVHLHNVERNADKMIPAKAKLDFSDGEIFLLLASILLHDLGRIIPDTFRHSKYAKKRAEPCPLRANKKNCPDLKRCYKEQKTHACRSRDLIRKNWAIFGLPDEQIARLCGLLAFWHGLDAPPSAEQPCGEVDSTKDAFCDTSFEPYGTIRMPLLASILRIADETEDTWTRAIRAHWYERYLIAKRAGDVYKAFRRHIADVEFFQEEGCIVLHVPGAEHRDTKANSPQLSPDRPDEIRKVIKAWSNHLAETGVCYRYVFLNCDGIPYGIEPGKVKGGIENHLQNVFSWPFFDNAKRKTLQKPLLRVEGMKEYLAAIERLIHGTRSYGQFSWSAVEGAIGEPLTPEKKWAIEWAGRVHPQLRIVSHRDAETVEIRILKKEGK